MARGHGSAARRLNRSAAVQSMGVGETTRCRSTCTTGPTTPQIGRRSASTLPRRHDRRRGEQALRAARAGRGHDGELLRSRTATPTRRCPGAGPAPTPSRRPVTIPITTTYTRRPAIGLGEPARCRSCPRRRSRPPRARRRSTARRARASTRARRSTSGASGSPAAAPATAARQGVDCGSSSAPGTAGSTYAKVTRHGDDLYFLVHVKDDFQSYAVTPAECVAHWQADSVELLIDPRGNASERNRDTANTFKLAVFPYTNDPGNTQRQRRQRPVLVARRRQPPGLLDRAAPEPGLRRPERPRRAGRDGRRVGRLQRHGASTTATPAAATRSRSRSRWPTSRPPWTRTGWA